MKKSFLVLLALLMSACGTEAIHIEIHNPSAAARSHETVEIDWSKISPRLTGVTPENVIVTTSDQRQIPSQVIYTGQSEPQSLIFQVSLPGAESAIYTISTGQREDYPVQTYGRFVPERLDDYAWENNRIAYRAYGPALKDPQTPGVDVWVKSTQRMIIDDWYAGADYHTNKGEGMDAYKVGQTLGGGATAPYAGQKLWLPGNYITQQRLDNGPIRTSVKLTYGSFDADGQEVSLEKTISLDANSHFNRITETYTGNWENLTIAAGFVLHDIKDITTGADYIAITEAVSDSKQPETDGDISLGIILTRNEGSAEIDGHLTLLYTAVNGEPFEYWSGSGWSQAGVTDSGEWLSRLLQKREQILEPLLITVQ